MNNFKRLAEEQGLYEKAPPTHIQNRVNDSMAFIEFFFDIVDLFIPRVISVFQDLLHASPRENRQAVNMNEHPLDKKPPRYPNRAD